MPDPDPDRTPPTPEPALVQQLMVEAIMLHHELPPESASLPPLTVQLAREYVAALCRHAEQAAVEKADKVWWDWLRAAQIENEGE